MLMLPRKTLGQRRRWTRALYMVAFARWNFQATRLPAVTRRYRLNHPTFFSHAGVILFFTACHATGDFRYSYARFGSTALLSRAFALRRFRFRAANKSFSGNKAGGSDFRFARVARARAFSRTRERATVHFQYIAGGITFLNISPRSSGLVDILIGTQSFPQNDCQHGHAQTPVAIPRRHPLPQLRGRCPSLLMISLIT